MKKRRYAISYRLLPVLVLFQTAGFFTALAFASPCDSSGQYVMGTILEIIVCPQAASTHQQVFVALFAEADRLDHLLTTYDSVSPVSKLNAHAGQGPLAVPPEVVELLLVSQQYSELTDKTFDVTVASLSHLWQQAAAHQRLPSTAVLRQSRTRIGNNQILSYPDGRVALRHTGAEVDFGGIGKGYALDRLITLGREYHLNNALLDFGQSSWWALGSPPNADGWRIVLQQADGRSVGAITLRNQALSVSASMGQTFTIQGQQYGHIIDPRSGFPLQRNLFACVVAPTATAAEAFSKALLILGPEKGPVLLEQQQGVEGLLIEGEKTWMTPGWQQAVTYVR